MVIEFRSRSERIPYRVADLHFVGTVSGPQSDGNLLLGDVSSVECLIAVEIVGLSVLVGKSVYPAFGKTEMRIVDIPHIGEDVVGHPLVGEFGKHAVVPVCRV